MNNTLKVQIKGKLSHHIGDKKATKV